MPELNVRAAPSGLSLAPALTASRGSRGSSEGSSTASEGAKEEQCSSSPMDLSSAGGGGGGTVGVALAATPPSPLLAATPASLAQFENHPLINARKLAEFVKAQHLVQKQRELNEISIRQSAQVQENEDEEDVLKEDKQQSLSRRPWEEEKPLIPLELIRAKWEGRSSPESAGSSNSAASTPSSSWPSSLTGSHTGGGRESKKRRLDELLSRKFAMSNSPSPPSSMEQLDEGAPPSKMTPPPPPPPILTGRRASNERKANRRKPMAVRASSELLLSPADTHPAISTVPASIASIASIASPLQISTATLAALPPLTTTKPRPDSLKSQILQLQLAQAALLSNAGTQSQNADFLKSALLSAASAPAYSQSPPHLPPPSLSSSAPNAASPLLYYGYYAQMLQGLQSSQSKLFEQIAAAAALKDAPKALSSPIRPPKPSPRKNVSASPKAAALFRSSSSPMPPNFKLPALGLRPLEDASSLFSSSASFPSFASPSTPRGSASSPQAVAAGQYSPTIYAGLSSPPAGGSSSPDEPRRRAPRALTGRHVRAGTGASVQTLLKLRETLLKRIKLKQILGENSHLYFGPLNRQKKGQTRPPLPGWLLEAAAAK